MIKFLARARDGEALVGLALSAQDLARLANGETIFLPLGELGAEVRVGGAEPEGGSGAVILFQAEEAEIEKRFREIDLKIKKSDSAPSPRKKSRKG